MSVVVKYWCPKLDEWGRKPPPDAEPTYYYVTDDASEAANFCARRNKADREYVRQGVTGPHSLAQIVNSVDPQVEVQDLSVVWQELLEQEKREADRVVRADRKMPTPSPEKIKSWVRAAAARRQ